MSQMKALPLAMVSILAVGCSPAPTSAPPPTAKREFRPPAKDFIAYKTPPEWVSEEVSDNMRKAQYRVPDRSGKGAAALLTFFNMSPQSEETIVDYWRDKMGGADANVSKIQGAATPTTLVDIAGEYTGENPPMANARFLGAIVDAGERTWYLKFVGPAGTVDGWRDAFVDMLKGLRPIE